LDAELRLRLEQSGYDRPGFAERYEAHRPRPPQALLELVPPLLARARPSLVVDLGCGTGLSTRFWAGAADEVAGVEPNDAMIEHARVVTRESNVRYVHASAYETGLPDACADLVTASQSFHWMRPERVFPELDRILRPGGVFCSYQYFVLQTPLWEPEERFFALRARIGELREERGLGRGQTWPVSRERLAESGVFRHVRELAVHGVEEGDGDRLVGFALSEGSLTTLLDSGVSEAEVGLDRLREAAEAMREPVAWWIGYRVWLGLR
jgi:SAM-dependent methyltransferase